MSEILTSRPIITGVRVRILKNNAFLRFDSDQEGSQIMNPACGSAWKPIEAHDTAVRVVRYLEADPSCHPVRLTIENCDLAQQVKLARRVGDWGLS